MTTPHHQIGLASPELASVLNYFSDPAILLSPDYRILAANTAYKEIYGESPLEQSRHCYEVSHNYKVPCDQAGETCPLKNAIASRSTQRVLHLHHTPRGEEHVDVETFPIMDHQGNVTALVEILRHIKTASSTPRGEALVGRSRQFNKMIGFIERVAPSQINVLLLGESGTGKELVAQAIHQASQRAKGALVPVECSGLTESLFESELFGHIKGAFTGAHQDKQGLVEVARGGTLFLDEIGDIPMNLQVKLLRLLETGTYRSVGSTETRNTDFRLVSATHRNLKKMVDKGQFRQDLYYRIASFPIKLPALRERTEDISLLIDTLLHRISKGCPTNIHPDALKHIQDYPFPGNIRELRNILEWACLMNDGDCIMPEHLPVELRSPRQEGSSLQTGLHFEGEPISLKKVENSYLMWAMAHHDGDRKTLARKLGLSERTFYRKLEQLLNPNNAASDNKCNF